MKKSPHQTDPRASLWCIYQQMIDTRAQLTLGVASLGWLVGPRTRRRFLGKTDSSLISPQLPTAFHQGRDLERFPSSTLGRQLVLLFGSCLGNRIVKSSWVQLPYYTQLMQSHSMCSGPLPHAMFPHPFASCVVGVSIGAGYPTVSGSLYFDQL